VPITPPDDPLSPNPGKAPNGRGWGAQRLSTRALFAIFRRHPRAGVGLVLGPAPGVVDLEVDDRVQAGPLLAELFPEGPPMTLGWDSSRGEHRLFRWDDRLGRAGSAAVHLAGGALEFRLGSGGKQLGAVCPPSPGAGGQPRRWNGIWEIAPCPEVLIEVVARMADAQVPRGRAGRAPRVRPGGAPGRYALAALEREADRVRTAGPGTRNSTLNRAAFRLGQLVAMRALDRTTVEGALIGLALPRRATLRKGWQDTITDFRNHVHRMDDPSDLSGAIAASALLQFAVVTLPPFQAVFDVPAHPGRVWLSILPLAVMPVTILEVAKLFRTWLTTRRSARPA
jgi:hypothetical protein